MHKYQCNKCKSFDISIEAIVNQDQNGNLEIVDACDKGHSCNDCGSDDIDYNFTESD